MTRKTLIPLMLAAACSVASVAALAQTTPSSPSSPTTPTVPSPSPSPSPSSTMMMKAAPPGTDATPTQAECDRMMKDHHKAGASAAMDDAMKAKMKQCHAMAHAADGGRMN